jgi:hypothetical protein
MTRKSFRSWIGSCIVAIACMLFFAGYAQGVESVGQTNTKGALLGVYIHTFTWSTASNGTLAAATSDRDITGYIIQVETDPGATAPQADYDVTLTDSVELMLWGLR